MMGLDFFRRSVELAEQLKLPHQRIAYTIQTNGTLLDDEWCAFFAENGFLVGLSASTDPREMHDTLPGRQGREGQLRPGDGGLGVLQRHGVEWNALTTIHAANQDRRARGLPVLPRRLRRPVHAVHPDHRARHARELPVANEGWGETVKDRPLYMQDGDLVTDRSVAPEGYGRFLIDVFDEWVAPRHRRPSTCRCSTSRWRTGTGTAGGSASTPRPAASRSRWSTPATCTRATTSSSRRTSSATSPRHA